MSIHPYYFFPVIKTPGGVGYPSRELGRIWGQLFSAGGKEIYNYDYSIRTDSFYNSMKPPLSICPEGYEFINIKASAGENISRLILQYQGEPLSTFERTYGTDDDQWNFGLLSAGKIIEIGKEKVFTEYDPDLCRKFFAEAFDLTFLTSPTLELLDITYQPTTINISEKYLSLVSHKVHVDRIGSFSCLDESRDLLSFIVEKNKDREATCFSLNNFFRAKEEIKDLQNETNIEAVLLKPQEIFALTSTNIFPMITTWEILDKNTFEWEPMKVFGFGILKPLEKVLRYTRSRDLLRVFIDNINQSSGEVYLDPQKWKEERKELLKKHTVYWNGIQKLYPNLSTFDLPLENKDAKEKKIKPEDISILSLVNEEPLLVTSKEYTEVKTALSNIEAKLQSNKDVLISLERNSKDLEIGLENYKRLLAGNQIRKKDLTEQIAGFLPSTNSLMEELDKKKGILMDTLTVLLKEKDNPGTKSNFIQNMANIGIIITDITYACRKDNTVLSISKDFIPALLARVDSINSEYILNSIRFYTEQPVIIKVDAGKNKEECIKIVGGPYSVECARGRGINVGLLTSSSCFGIYKISKDAFSIRIHPHTDGIPIYSSQPMIWKDFAKILVTERRGGCLGEAETSFYHALEKNDPKLLIIAALTWLSNANSSDTWGQYYKYFPLLEDTYLGKKVDIDMAAKEPSCINGTSTTSIELNEVEPLQEAPEAPEDEEDIYYCEECESELNAEDTYDMGNHILCFTCYEAISAENAEEAAEGYTPLPTY